MAAIGTCERGNYHVVNDYSYVELLPAGNSLYEIVGTSFSNYAMPLIRYRTGDYAELDETVQCSCGRDFPVVRCIHGRDDEYVKLSDGRHIGRMDHVFKGVEGILEAQFVQDSIDELLIRLVPADKYNKAIENMILSNARSRLGLEIRISIEKVEKIERNRSGKFRNVICNV